MSGTSASGASGAAFPRRTLGFIAGLFVIDVGGAYGLDALGLVEGLLSPQGGRLALLLPLALVFHTARLLLLFVAPGLGIAALALWAARRRG